MRRPILVLAIVATLLTGVLAWLGWQHLSQMSEHIESLREQVIDLGVQASSAETRASEAEAKAEQAQSSAGEAAERATEAATRELASTEQAEQAEVARLKAIEERQRAMDAQERAELLTQVAERAEAVAEEQRVAAEQEREKATTKAAVAELEARQAHAETEKVQRLLQREVDRLQGALGKIADTRRTALGLVMTLDSRQIEFDFNKAELRPLNREVLSRVAGVLFTFKDYGVQIFGHTDDVGSVEYNKKLSGQRAEAVKEYLVEAGISPEVLTTSGLGKSSPLVEGTDPKSRQRNRRVELAIVFAEGEFGAVLGAREEH
jgi:outer membrane protein OmpA-like peptidoglycan-associated protein